jgi:hypothetical protein
MSTAKQWEVLNTTLGAAVDASDEDFPVMTRELMRQCASLTRDSPPKATWKKLLQQNVSPAAGAAEAVGALLQCDTNNKLRALHCPTNLMASSDTLPTPLLTLPHGQKSI